MIECKQCYDYDLVKQVFTHPNILPNIVDDYYFELGSEIAIDTNNLYFTVHKDNTLLGLAMLRPMSLTCWELHTCILPEASGQSSVCAHALMAKLLEFDYVEKLVTWVPEDNKAALLAAQRAGFKEEGYVRDSILRGGKLIGQYIYGVTL